MASRSGGQKPRGQAGRSSVHAHGKEKPDITCSSRCAVAMLSAVTRCIIACSSAACEVGTGSNGSACRGGAAPCRAELGFAGGGNARAGGPVGDGRAGAPELGGPATVCMALADMALARHGTGPAWHWPGMALARHGTGSVDLPQYAHHVVCTGRSRSAAVEGET